MVGRSHHISHSLARAGRAWNHFRATCVDAGIHGHAGTRRPGMEQVSGAIRRIAIVGAGGFAREVAWLIRDINRAKHTYELTGFIVSDPTRLSDHDSRDQVLG